MPYLPSLEKLSFISIVVLILGIVSTHFQINFEQICLILRSCDFQKVVEFRKNNFRKKRFRASKKFEILLFSFVIKIG